MLMETFQLGFGESAFTYFFSREPTPLHGPLTAGQRLRVVTICLAWVSGIIFVTLQGYLFLLPNTQYWVALTSYYGEVIGLILAFAMPAISGVDYLLNQEDGTVMQESERQIKYHLAGQTQQDGTKKQD